MSATQRRVLHGNQQCEQVFDVLATAGLASFRVPLQRSNGPKEVRTFCGVDFLTLMMSAFRRFYCGTELATRFQSAIAEIDTKQRTIILTHVRLRHRRRDLPKVVHDLQVY